MGQRTAEYEFNGGEKKENKKYYTGYFQVAHISEKIKIRFPVHWGFFCKE